MISLDIPDLKYDRKDFMLIQTADKQQAATPLVDASLQHTKHQQHADVIADFTPAACLPNL
jgi:hypothetical protein